MTSKSVLDIFKLITAIPRESGHEEPMTRFLCDWAAAHGLECRKDATGNVCIVREAAKGKEHVPAIALQAHQDMVCEKLAGVQHDFRKDPVKYEIEDGWMIAKQTTLGADDGIGIAACLALLESDEPTGKIECVFTISEETGMDGAFAMEPGFFDAKLLINLDSEDEGQIFIGCAGGIITVGRLKLQKQAIEANSTAFRIDVKGLRGGHSGDDIHKGYGNANKILNRFLWNATKLFDIKLCNFDGGNLHNAIPRNATATFTIGNNNEQNLTSYFDIFKNDICQELKYTESQLVIKLTRTELPEDTMTHDCQTNLLNAIYGCPNGPIAMSHALPGLVETSTNLASVKTNNADVEIVTSQRSSVESAKNDIAAMVESVFAQAGMAVEHSDGYPGWEPNTNSAILSTAVTSYKRLFGKEPEVKAIHAGLECGLFLKKIPGMDMISIGPTLRGVHSPGERIEIKTVKMFYDFLIDILKNI